MCIRDSSSTVQAGDESRGRAATDVQYSSGLLGRAKRTNTAVGEEHKRRSEKLNIPKVMEATRGWQVERLSLIHI